MNLHRAIMFGPAFLLLLPMQTMQFVDSEWHDMGSQTDYFERIGYRPKYFLGDRVFGHWNKIPFVGTVGNDTLISEIEGPRITIHLDLPIKYQDTWHNVIVVKHKDIKVYKWLGNKSLPACATPTDTTTGLIEKTLIHLG